MVLFHKYLQNWSLVRVGSRIFMGPSNFVDLDGIEPKNLKNLLKTSKNFKKTSKNFIGAHQWAPMCNFVDFDEIEPKKNQKNFEKI